MPSMLELPLPSNAHRLEGTGGQGMVCSVSLSYNSHIEKFLFLQEFHSSYVAAKIGVPLKKCMELISIRRLYRMSTEWDLDLHACLLSPQNFPTAKQQYYITFVYPCIRTCTGYTRHCIIQWSLTFVAKRREHSVSWKDTAWGDMFTNISLRGVQCSTVVTLIIRTKFHMIAARIP